MSYRASTVLSTLAVTLLLVPASAQAAERWAAPDGNGAAPCLEADPCSLADAVGGAFALDEIVLTTGSADYTAAATLNVPNWVTLRAADADDRPRIVADNAFSGSVVAATGANALVAGVEIVGTSSSTTPVDLDAGATGAQLVLRSPAISARVNGAGTVLRDTLTITTGTGSSAAAVFVRDGTAPSPARLVNVTALGEAGAARGVRCGAGHTKIDNTIIRGAGLDVHDMSTACTISTSAYRTAKATPSVVDGGGNVGADPVYEATGDHVPALTSPTVDAGREDGTEATRRDVNGQARVQGGKLDMGAHEATPAPAPTPVTDAPVDPATPGAQTPSAPTTPAAATPLVPTPAAPRTDAQAVEAPLPPATAPDLGKSVTLQAAAGTVRVKLPGAGGYVDLSDASTLPVGTVVDTNDGSVTLTSQLADGTTQTGTFGGGKFSVDQPADEQGMTDIALRGGWFQSCIPVGERAARAALKAKGKVTARAATAAGRKRKPVRSLWSKDRGGKFRTHGSTSITTVRGTSWVTEDRCEGTVTKVTEGAVDVKAKRSSKVTRVAAGDEVLVKRLPRAKLR